MLFNGVNWDAAGVRGALAGVFASVTYGWGWLLVLVGGLGLLLRLVGWVLILFGLVFCLW